MRVFYICNIFDEKTRRLRGAKGQSSAASRKVSAVCQAINSVVGGCRVRILSLGLSGSRYPSQIASGIVRVGVNVISYPPGTRMRILTQIVSVIFTSLTILKKAKRDDVVIFYNYFLLYVPTLIAAKFKRCACVLDIEDGPLEGGGLQGVLSRSLFKLFNISCGAGTVAASTALAQLGKASDRLVCYGVAKRTGRTNLTTSSGSVRVHYGGSINDDAGLDLFLSAVDLVALNPALAQRVKFVVTGVASPRDIDRLKLAAHSHSNLDIKLFLDPIELDAILNDSQVGLQLKLPTSTYGKSTFPSKIIEMAERGMLIVSTNISDVQRIFGSSAIFLSDATAVEIERALNWIASNTADASRKARSSQEIVCTEFNMEATGQVWQQFLRRASSEKRVMRSWAER